MSPVRLAAFVEYVVRPLMEDFKQILEQLKALGFRYDAETLFNTAKHLMICHIGLELFRNLIALLIAGLVCWTAWHILA